MEIINLNRKEFDNVFSPYNFFKDGGEGALYRYDNNNLIKISYFNYDKIVENEELEFNDGYYKLITELIKRKDMVKKSILPSTLVTYNNIPVASIMKCHKKYDTLEVYEDDNSVLDCLKAIKKSFINYKELIDNGIFHDDFFSNNILVNENGKVQIIDFDSNFVYVDYDDTETMNKKIATSFYYLLYLYIDGIRYDDKKKILNEINSLDTYQEYMDYTDELINTKSLKKAEKPKRKRIIW